MMMEFHRPGDPVADILFNWLPLIGAALVCAVGLHLLSLGFAAYVKAAILRRSGVAGRAIVTAKWVEKGYVSREERRRTRPMKRYWLRFERREGRRRWAAKDIAPLGLWEETEPGAEVDVVYLPRGPFMQLSGWPNRDGRRGGGVQMSLGAVMAAGAGAMILEGAVAAMEGPDYREPGPNWIVERAEVLQVGQPANPYHRVFAPSKRLIRVVFGDTQGGAWMANQRHILISPEQADGIDLVRGAVLKAWMNPADEYDAILEIERDRFAR